MKTVIGAALIVFVGTFALLFYASSCQLEQVYGAKLQVPLFAGFLTLGSFLLTLKTFVIVKLKESLYDTDFYKKRVKKMRELQSELSMYGPLKTLSTFLVYAVIVSLGTATAQLTVGFLPSRLAVAACLSAAATTLFVVAYAWLLIKRNLADLFLMWEEASNQPAEPAAPAASASLPASRS